jgi:hypothetical protein
VLDVRALVVTELCRDKRVLVQLFQAVGHCELEYLCNSGLWFGLLLGLVQMAQYALYPARWTIPFGGLVVSAARARDGPTKKACLGRDSLASLILCLFVLLCLLARWAWPRTGLP